MSLLGYEYDYRFSKDDLVTPYVWSRDTTVHDDGTNTTVDTFFKGSSFTMIGATRLGGWWISPIAILLPALLIFARVFELWAEDG